MQNDFEKNIAQRMQEFSIAPQPEIWQQVEAALPPEKKRRIAFWWWLLPLVGLLGGGIWLTILTISKQPTGASKEKTGMQQNTFTQTESSTEPTEKNPGDTTTENLSIAQLQNTEKKNAQRQESDSVFTVETTTSIGDRKDKISTSVSVARKKRLSRRVSKDFEKARQLSTNSSIARVENKTNRSQPDLSSGESERVVQTYAGNVPLAKPDASFINTVKDTISPLPIEKNATIDSVDAIKSIADTAVTTHSVAAKKTVPGKPRRSNWMVEAGVGQSWQQQQTNSSNSLYASPQYTTGPVVSLPASYASFVQPKTSFSFSLGIVRKQTISQHWNWQLALRYQLLSTTQAYGSRRDSLANFNAANAARIYNPGDTLVYHNYVHQVQLAPRIEYTIHPASHFPVSIHTGLSIAYNISSNQLLHDYRSYNYLRSSAQSNKWLYSAEIGATVFLYKKVYAGLLYQYGLTNVAKPALQSDYRWRVWQFRMALPLFNHSSK